MDTIKSSNLIKMLNLGSGGQPIDGAVNVDLFDGPGVDQVVDLNGPWPWADHSVFHIFTAHCVEHLDDVIHFMREANRVLAVGGIMEIRVPYGWDTAAMCDPTHKRPFYLGSFTPFCVNTIAQQDARNFNYQQSHVRWDFGFEMEGVEFKVRDWVKKLPFWKHYYMYLAEIFLNVICEIRVHFRKVK